jgi:predicted enzyme related to lactoylglutathione lyase
VADARGTQTAQVGGAIQEPAAVATDIRPDRAFEPWGPPGFYLIHTGDEASPGIQGLMHTRQEPRTGTGLNGVEPTFSVDDVDAIAALVEANGGRVTVAKSVIPTVGALVRFLDPEGNDIGAMAYDVPPHT